MEEKLTQHSLNEEFWTKAEDEEASGETMQLVKNL